MANEKLSPSIPVDQCLKLVDAAQTCPAQALKTEIRKDADLDQLSVAIANQANAFSWGALLLGCLGLVGAIGWGLIVKVWAEKTAQKEAKECADKMIAKWLSDEAPGIVRQHVEYLNNTSLGTDDDAEAADQIGKGAG